MKSAKSMRSAKLVVVRRNGGEALLVRRRRDRRWTFPGGKRLSHESPEQCLKREISEELPDLAFAIGRRWQKLRGKTPIPGDE